MTRTLNTLAGRAPFWKPVAFWTAVLSGALAIGVAGAVVLNNQSPPPPPQPFEEIQQSGLAAAQGVEIEPLGASYSGTETLLRLRVRVQDEQSVLRGIGEAGPIRRVIPSGTGYAGPFDGTPLTSTVNGLGEVLVHLPPLEVGAQYDGVVEFVMTTLAVHLDTGVAVLDGRWALELNGPKVTEVANQLRVETFNPTELSIAGGNGTVTGVRSRSETRVSIVLPEGVQMLSQPVLRTDAARLAPRSFNADGGNVTASFEATPFEETVVLEFGTLALAGGAGTETFAVDFDDLLSQAGQLESFGLTPGSILAGDADLVVRGEQGEYGDRPWAGLVLAGDWHPENGQPIVSDANGSILELAHVQVGYEKDVNGIIREGTTAVAFFVDGGADLSRVNILLGARSVVDRTPYAATLVPGGD